MPIANGSSAPRHQQKIRFIMTDEQAERYYRQILLKEIGAEGQRRLMAASVPLARNYEGLRLTLKCSSHQTQSRPLPPPSTGASSRYCTAFLICRPRASPAVVSVKNRSLRRCAAGPTRSQTQPLNSWTGWRTARPLKAEPKTMVLGHGTDVAPPVRKTIAKAKDRNR